MPVDTKAIKRLLEISGENPERRPVAGMPYTLLDLHCMFAKVQDKRNWRLPIFATIEEYELSVAISAIIFFTGGPVARVNKLPNGKLEIIAHGYYFHTGCG
jgi:hypothetical protein